jgi:hypothetical protein
MKKLFAILPALVLAGSLQLSAQSVTPHPNLTAPQAIPRDRYEDVDGSPYFNNDWNKGIIQLNKGITYKDVNVKFDEVTQQLIILYKDRTYRLAEPVNEFKLSDANGTQSHFMNGYGDNKKEFYEVLAQGSVGLLKSTAKHITKNTTYPLGSGLSKTVTADDKYYLYVNNAMISVKADARAILKVIGNKQDVLVNYIKNNSLNLKDQNDFAKLINYYNSI